MMNRKAMDALGDGTRLLIEMHPQSGKTTYLQYLAGWYMGRAAADPDFVPGAAVMYATHTMPLVSRQGGRIRRDIDQAGAQVFGVRVASDTRAKADFVVEHIGGRLPGVEFYGVGAHGSPHGRGATLLITDDLVPNAEAAQSDIQVEAVGEFLRHDLLSRRRKGFVHVGIQTRWSDQDPHGIMLALYPDLYVRLRLPALAEDDDPLGRARGEAMWPEQFPVSVLEEQRRGMHPNRFAALYQQRPTPEEGGIWRRAWWHGRTWTSERRNGEVWLVLADGYACPLAGCLRFCTVDLATSEKEMADYTVILCAALTGESPRRLIVLDVRRSRMEAPDIMPAIKKAMSDYALTVAYLEEQGNQKWGAQFAKRAGIAARTIGTAKDSNLRIPGDKVAVAYEAAPVAEAGRLWVPKDADWFTEWEHEMLTFPTGKRDQADATAWACLLAKQSIESVTAGRVEKKRDRERSPLEARSLAAPARGLAEPR